MLGVICEVQDQVVGVNWEVQGRMGRAICTKKLPMGFEFASPGCRLEFSTETEICSMNSQILAPIGTRICESGLQI